MWKNAFKKPFLRSDWGDRTHPKALTGQLLQLYTTLPTLKETHLPLRISAYLFQEAIIQTLLPPPSPPKTKQKKNKGNEMIGKWLPSFFSKHQYYIHTGKERLISCCARL